MMSTLWEAFRRSLLLNTSRPAITVADSTWTYRDLAVAVSNAAARLHDAGARPRDRVVLLCENGASFPVYDLAIMAIGAVKIPLNSMLTAADIADIVVRTEPAVAVVSPGLDHLAVDIDASCVRIVDSVTPPGSAWVEPPVVGAVGPDDLAFVGFTGGTTGKPKGIVHHQAPMVLNMFAHIMEAGLARDEHMLLTTPLPHAAGFLGAAGLLRGAHLRVEAGFDATDVLDIMDRHDITWTFAVPTMIYRMLDVAVATGARPASLRTVQYGAAPISPERLRQAIDIFGPVFQQLYAQTECPNFATVLSKQDHVRALDEPALLSSCGKATLLCDVAIIDDDGTELPAGEIGEVALDSPYVMRGYWNDPENYAARFAGRWMRTGDVGRMDTEGFVTLVDRANDMIVSGGMNVYSVEVENVISAHPDVAQVAVVGIPHEDWGEAVHAVVVPRAGLDTEAFGEYCREHLAAYKRPKSINYVDDLPVTVYGKVDKKALRAPFWTDATRNVG